MKIQQKLLLLPILGFMSLGMVGCNGGSKSDYVPFEGDPTQLTAKISFWHTMGQENQKTLNRMIEAFNEKYPNITIEHAAQGGYDDIKDKISAAIPAGTTPTMAYCYPDHVAEYMSAGAIEEMSGYTTDKIIGFGKEEWDSKGGVEDFIPSFWEEGKSYGEEYGVKDGLYSVPFSKSTEVLFYNATVFEAYGWSVPTTWDEMWTLCSTMKSQLGNKIKTPLGYDSDSNLFITKCVQENIPYTSKDASVKSDYFKFNNAQAKSMVTDLKAKFDAGLFITKGTQPNSTYTSTAFTNQQIIMSIGSTGGTTYNKSLNFDIGVAPLPKGSVNGKVVSQGPSICIFSRASEAEKIAAWKFYKHITSPDNTATFAINTGYEPVRDSARETPQFKTYLSRAGENYITKRGGDLLASAAALTRDKYAGNYFASDVFPGSDTARDEVGGIISSVFLNAKSIDKAFDDALTNCLYVG